MKFDAKVLLPIAFKIIAAVPTAIAAVEHLKDTFKDKTAPSQAKEDAAVTFVQSQVQSIEDIADKDLVNDPAVVDALRGAMKALVNVQNVIAAAKAIKPVAPVAQ